MFFCSVFFFFHVGLVPLSSRFRIVAIRSGPVGSVSFRFVSIMIISLRSVTFRFGSVRFVSQHGEQYVLTDGKDEEHLSRGVYDTYTNTSLRCVLCFARRVSFLGRVYLQPQPFPPSMLFPTERLVFSV